MEVRGRRRAAVFGEGLSGSTHLWKYSPAFCGETCRRPANGSRGGYYY